MYKYSYYYRDPEDLQQHRFMECQLCHMPVPLSEFSERTFLCELCATTEIGNAIKYGPSGFDNQARLMAQNTNFTLKKLGAFSPNGILQFPYPLGECCDCMNLNPKESYFCTIKKKNVSAVHSCNYFLQRGEQ